LIVLVRENNPFGDLFFSWRMACSPRLEAVQRANKRLRVNPIFEDPFESTQTSERGNNIFNHVS